ncbi:MAG TPA: hypothetical protein VLB27_07495, partial [candidate division Zixibacteria bacterium]|nr:hypothetical protein [candidate division Zixibacteria bacterium]
FVDRAPEPTGDGVYFTSDRDGASNVYFRDNDGEFRQVTNALTGVFDPRVCPENSDLIYTGYQNFQFQIYRRELGDSLAVVPAAEFVETPGINAWRPGALTSDSIESSARYENEYSIDLAQTAVSYDPIFGALGGLQVMMSDMLGDHVYVGFLSNSAETKDQIFTSFNAGLSYYNLKNRLNWGVGAFHFYDGYYNEVEGNFFERQAGGYGQLRYPLSRFERLETTMYVRWRDKDRFLVGARDRDFLVSNFLTFVSDNSLWEPTGPIDGRRINLTIGVTTSVDERRFNDVVAMADFRNYYRLGRGSAFATRIFGYTSGGDDPRRIYHGGSWSFRGYDRRQWYVPTVVFISNELRFPLINRLLVGLPIGNLGFSAIRGALFYDTGAAWESEFERFLGSFGYGFRVGLGRLIAFRFDWSWRHDYKRIEPGPDF